MPVWNETLRLCGNCRYWPLADQDFAGVLDGSYAPVGVGFYGGECHRHPPRVFSRPNAQSGTLTAFPVTDSAETCGDFKYRKPPPPPDDVLERAAREVARAGFMVTHADNVDAMVERFWQASIPAAKAALDAVRKQLLEDME